jgi:hyperosmotically inducible protein
MKFRALLIAAAVSAGLAGLAGCDRNEPTRQAAPPPSSAPDRATAPTPPATARTPPSDRATAPGDSGRSVGQTLDDAGITAKVKTALLAEKGVNGTMQGRVTLTGRVPDQAQVDRAAQVASSVEGVKAVENKLTAGG